MGACCSRRKKTHKKRNTDDSQSESYPVHDDVIVINAQRNARRRAAREKLEYDKERLEERLQLTNDPFVLLPEVVVLDHLEKYLETPEDKKNLCSASPAAENLLRKYRVKWLLNEILQIPEFLAYLSKEDILNLRLTCRDWKCSFDNLFESLNNPVEPDYKNYKSITTSPSTISLACCRRRYMRLSTSWTPKVGDSDFDSTCERLLAGNEDEDPLETPAIFNPFPSKRVYFKPSFLFWGHEEEDNYWRDTHTILDRFGSHLHFVRISCCLQTLPLATTLNIVKGTLERVPYLTTFDCDLFNVIRNDQYDIEALRNIQFPQLPHLKSLTISHGCAPIYESFSVYFSQLVFLQVQSSANFISWYNPQTHLFPKLRHLALGIETVDDMVKIQSLKSPLREIDIQSGLCNICPSAYFQVLEHFKETLCAIKVDLDFICNLPLKTMQPFGLPEVAIVDLPNLKTLCLNVMDCGFGPLMDPLLKLSHPPEYLEIIVVNCPWKAKTKIKEHKFRKNIEDMYESKMWTSFPFLKSIHVRETPTCGRSNWLETYYSREVYELRQLS